MNAKLSNLTLSTINCQISCNLRVYLSLGFASIIMQLFIAFDAALKKIIDLLG